MKQYLVFGIFLYISQRNKTTAKEIAENFEISTRTVYRYIDALSMAGVPIISESGKYGGVYLAPNFSLENIVLSQQEKDTLKSAFKIDNLTQQIKCILDKICV